MRRLIPFTLLLISAASAHAAPYGVSWDAATRRALETENARREAAAKPETLADPATDTMAPPAAAAFSTGSVTPATPSTPVMASDTRSDQPSRRLSDDDASPFTPGEGYGERSRATPRIVNGGAKGEAVNQSILSIDQLTKPQQ